MVDIAKNLGYSILDSEYFKFYKKINFLHIKCGKDFEMMWSSFVAGHRCPTCSKVEGGKKRTIQSLNKHNLYIDYPEICKFIDYEKNIDFNPRNFSKSSGTKIWWKCPECQYSWIASIISRVKSGEKCPKCIGLDKPEISKIRNFAKDKGFTLLSKSYINNRGKLEFIHDSCGYPISVSWHGFSRIVGCKNCYKSSSEDRIFKKLKAEGLIEGKDFYVEHRFEECRSKRTLPFDFYIPKLNLCIESHGEQHYKPVRFGGMSIEKASENLKSSKSRDKIKRVFCKKNKINLEIIKYTDFKNIENIVDIILNKYGWWK